MIVVVLGTECTACACVYAPLPTRGWSLNTARSGCSWIDGRNTDDSLEWDVSGSFGSFSKRWLMSPMRSDISLSISAEDMPLPAFDGTGFRFLAPAPVCGFIATLRWRLFTGVGAALSVRYSAAVFSRSWWRPARRRSSFACWRSCASLISPSDISMNGDNEESLIIIELLWIFSKIYSPIRRCSSSSRALRWPRRPWAAKQKQKKKPQISNFDFSNKKKKQQLIEILTARAVTTLRAAGARLRFVMVCATKDDNKREKCINTRLLRFETLTSLWACFRVTRLAQKATGFRNYWERKTNFVTSTWNTHHCPIPPTRCYWDWQRLLIHKSERKICMNDTINGKNSNRSVSRKELWCEKKPTLSGITSRVLLRSFLAALARLASHFLRAKT